MIQIDNESKEFLNICENGTILFNVFEEEPCFILKEEEDQDFNEEDIKFIFFEKNINNIETGIFMVKIKDNIYESMIWNTEAYSYFIETLLNKDYFYLHIIKDKTVLKEIKLKFDYKNRLLNFSKKEKHLSEIDFLSLKETYFKTYPNLLELFLKEV